MHLLLVTGNQGKLKEWQSLLPDGITIESIDIDLPEIQSMSPEEIVADKARRAYEIIKKPLIVEDVSAGLERLGGLPGPFIKFFIKTLGEGALRILAGQDGERAKIACVIAYYDGKDMLTIRGEVDGTVVAPRGTNGFGFDKVLVPDGQSKTYGEMTIEEKNSLSHRSKAIEKLIEALAK